MTKYIILVGILAIVLIVAVVVIKKTKNEKNGDLMKDTKDSNLINNNTDNSTAEKVHYEISDYSQLKERGAKLTYTDDMIIYLGNTQKITLKSSVKPVKMVAFQSLNEKVAIVSEGVVIAISVGKTSIIITTKIKEKYYEFIAEVTVKPGKVIVSSDSETIGIGETTRLKTMVSSGVFNTLSYTSDNTDVASVKKDGIYGIVAGKAPGNATITVKVGIGGKTKTSKVEIQVEKKEQVVLPVSNPVNAKDYTIEDDWQGSRVYFGHYEQDKNLLNGNEPILWRVLEVTEEDLLLISEYGLICKNYNDTFEDVTWETSTLRGWLNGTFLDTAFTNRERDAIKDTLVSNANNQKYNTPGGNDTLDKVFLLSYEEAQNNAFGFQSGVSNKSKSRQMRLTEAALEEGYVNKDNGNTCWWLRTPGITNQYAAYVFTVGSITDSYFVGRRNDAARPVIRVKLSSIMFGENISDGNSSYPEIIAK